MKTKGHSMFYFLYKLPVIGSLILFSGSLQAQDISDIIKGSAANHTAMWWVNSVKEQDSLKFAVKTTNYSFVFNYQDLQFEDFSITHENSKPLLEFGIETYGKLYPCRLSSQRSEDCQLIHSGRFLQHRFINWIPELTGCDPHSSGLDVVAWNDRLSLNPRVVPTVNLRAKTISVNFTVPENYTENSTDENIKVFCNKEGSGYIILPVDENTRISTDKNRVSARLSSENNFQAGEELYVGLIIYPVTNIHTQVDRIKAIEKEPLQITAIQKSPKNISLDVAYEPDMGWHRICLRNDITGIPEKDNDHFEQVLFTVRNDKPYPVPIRLNFSKDDKVFSITGISAIIRDEKGNPTGIPVQLSKNWHTIDFNQFKDHRYRGNWFHGLTMLEIPPHSNLTLEYTGVNAHWGNIPAASHAQLCLVGWGQNQLWDQSAIGS